jgi:site-specific DNA recombinase
MTTEGKTSVRELLRVSQDRSGRERSIDEQQDDNRRVWADVEFGEPYSDVGSASRYARKARGDFKRLTADLGGGRFGADVLVLWESSRGSRKVGEWVELIELCEARGVRIAVTEHHRIYDPANARDRRSLLEDAVDSEYESAKTSARAKRAAAANAAAGVPHGPVPYGYRRRYDPQTRRYVAQEPEPTEAAVIRELFERVRKGHSIRSIAADFEARGVRSRAGKTFTAAYLRHFMNNPAYVGLRVHVAGRGAGGSWTAIRDGEFTQGTWEPLVSRSTWLAVRRILDAPDRKTNRPGRAVHLLSMIVRCDVCSDVLIASKNKKINNTLWYRCRRAGHVQVDYAELNDYAEMVITGYLARPDNVERLTRNEGNGEALTAAKEQVAEITAELDDLADRLGRGQISGELAARAEPGIIARLQEAERRRDELETPDVLRGLIEPGKDVGRRWKAAPLSAKRVVARRLLVPELIGELRIARKDEQWRKVPVDERITWRTS